ncbi:MAG: hypothetical protein CM15mP46_0560 [Alphaproteobacteria bacterium]|nr:MAG: hypothetical protein CM15mP46_0560 [Alphaproteobacteria bacterium]
MAKIYHPAPFDPRLISAVSSAVAKAAMDSGVARRPISDLDSYRRNLSARLDPTASTLQVILDRVSALKSVWSLPKAKKNG